MARAKATPPATTPKFDEHLEAMRLARTQVDAAVSTLDQALGLANHSVKVTGEFLFDHLCRGKQKELSIPQLNMLAGIVYRLAQTMEKLKKVEGDTRAKNKALTDATRQIAGFPQELRESMEREFQVM